MARKTYVDGGKKAIVYNNDREPVRVYVDGELQSDISYTEQSVTGEKSVTYESEYKKNLLSLEIEGATTQPIRDVYPSFSELTEVTATGPSGETLVSFCRYIPYELQGIEGLTYSVKLTGYINEDVVIGLGKNGSWYTGTQAYTLYHNGVSTPLVTTADDMYDNICICTASGMIMRRFEAESFLENCEITVTQSVGADTLISPTTPAEMINTGDGKIEIELNSITNSGVLERSVCVEIPDSVTLKDGSEIPMRFAGGFDQTAEDLSYEYTRDKLIIENNKVKYIKCFEEYVVTGEETLINSSDDLHNCAMATFEISGSYGFVSMTYNHLEKCNCAISCSQTWDNGKTMFNVYNGQNAASFMFYMPTASNTQDMINKFKELYFYDKPVKILYPLETPEEIDITDTDIGRELLSLANCTKNQTTVIEISNDIDPINMKAIYAKWGGDVNA